MAEEEWGDRLDDVDSDQVIDPDENGIKKMVDYKFGGAVHDDAGSRLTTVSTEEIFFESPTAAGTNQDQTSAAEDSLATLVMCRICGMKGEHCTENCPYKDLSQPSESFTGTNQDQTSAAEDSLAQMGKGKGIATLMVCKICGTKGDHWTATCPYKVLSEPSGSFTDKPPSETNAAVGVITEGAYVPPSKSGDASVSEDTGEPDLPQQPCQPVSPAVPQSDSRVLSFFMMYGFKVYLCTYQKPHDMRECSYYHSLFERRRSPLFNPYGFSRCWGVCERGEDCPYAHSALEAGLHPLTYRTQFCIHGDQCTLDPCFYAHAHSPAQLRLPGYTVIPSEALLRFPHLPMSFPFGIEVDEEASSFNRLVNDLKEIFLELDAAP